jgi:uncharacterized protein (TIGR00255 family)
MIHSMTAFAAKENKQPWGVIAWEIRSVNHRYLDVSFRLPEALRDMEFSLRDVARNILHRGKVECTLKLQMADQEAAQITLNDTLLNHLIRRAEHVASKLEEPAAMDPMKLLMWPGVVVQAEQDQAAIKETMQSLFKATLESFVECRQREGQALKQAIKERLTSMENHVDVVAKTVPTLLEAQRQKISDRIQELTQDVDQSRLEQELVYFAQRMDVAEEVDRLQTHIKEMSRVLEQDGAAGRRLDFLLQEMNREANTIGSKSQHTITSHACVELKVLIEQIREQVQNIE